MTVIPLLAVGFIMKIIAVLFILCCVVLILVVLIQKGKGGGLSGAFGGAMASGLLGSKTGDFLTWVTIVLVGVFLLLASIMAKYYKPAPARNFDITPTTQQQPVTETEKPATSGNTGGTTGETNEGTEANSPGSDG